MMLHEVEGSNSSLVHYLASGGLRTKFKNLFVGQVQPANEFTLIYGSGADTGWTQRLLCECALRGPP